MEQNEKNEAYYSSLDKRTKEYKEWVAKFEQQPAGLGDTIEQITEATGIKAAVKFLAGEDCKCDERKKKLNEIFRYGKPECLKEDEFKFLSEFYAQPRNLVSGEDKVMLIKIYNRVFRANKKVTSCGSCLKSTYDQLKQYFESYQ